MQVFRITYALWDVRAKRRVKGKQELFRRSTTTVGRKGASEERRAFIGN
jgi:hypothetical protein